MTTKELFTIKTLERYMKIYNLNDWKYRINKRKHSAGVCKYISRTIEISKYYIDNENVTKKDIENTILHEIAHSLTKGEGHSDIWMKKFIEIGGNGKTYCKKFSK